MRTIRSAAELLAAAGSLETLAPLVAQIVGPGTPDPLDAETVRALELPAAAGVPHILRGPGTLRALLVELRGAASPREGVTQIAARLARRAPQLLWLVAATERHGGYVALATWSADRSPPRVVALVVDRARVVDSDAETVCALAAARGAADVLTHARWLEILGRDALTRRFYRTLERVVHELAAAADGAAGGDARRESALLVVSRLLFLSFLEAKGWLNGDRAFLTRGFQSCVERGGGYQRRVLSPLFFGTLNTPPRARAPAARAFGQIPFLNGGLFARSPIERQYPLRFDDASLGAIFDRLLLRYRFTAREESTDWSEAAVDPEMLGRAFESLMASDERRDSGAFYTPHAMVQRVTEAALREALGATADGGAGEAVLRGEPLHPAAARRMRERLLALRVLDPACGSGAFLVHALERIAELAARCGDARPASELRREVLTQGIFGVDVNPTAAWLCALRLWLSMVIESDETDPLRVSPLPNLDRHIRVGDSLSGAAFDVGGAPASGALRAGRLRASYARAVGRRKETLARTLDREERLLALAALERTIRGLDARRRDLIQMLRARDLFGERRRPAAADRARLGELRARIREARAARRALSLGGALPFSFAAHFADVAARGGFDLVLGNPPWVRLHNIPPAMRRALRREYQVYRQAAWRDGAAHARAGSGFAGQVDLAALFVERSLALLRPGGTLALLVPVKLWRALAGGGVRHLLLEWAELRALEDWSESRPAFDAAVYPSLIVARRIGRSPVRHDGDGALAPAAASHPVARPRAMVSLHRRDDRLCWPLPPEALPLDASVGSPWLIVPPEVRAAFDDLSAKGVALAAGPLGRPLLGVKSGCNEAFIVRADPAAAAGEQPGDTRGLVAVRSGDRTAEVECRLLRPALRGERLERWRTASSGEWVIWTHGREGGALECLPPGAERWMAHWRDRLLGRADARGRRHWWSLFRIEAAASERPRVVWSDFGRTPRAAVLHAGDMTVPLNSCYVLPCANVDDARAFAALLNGPLCAAWLRVLAEPARGGWHRYLGWTMALVPLPRDWPRARALLAPLAARAATGSAPSTAELLDAALCAYRVRPGDVAPLLGWAAR